ncbi:MAG: SOS response-associated peptidase [Desulfomonile tiedjei]|nr:SOS response-associated peptidase [Desulfomonile tiedjei]
MCGRFVLMTLARSLASHFRLAEEPELSPRYNIAPTETIAIVRVASEEPRRLLVMVTWGLVPSWAKDRSMGPRLINARAESAAEKPAFRAAFKYRRCLVPADGFYEWKKIEGRKQPYLFGNADRKVFAFAGLWERWSGPEGEVVESATILTTDANELLMPIHDRMPVILAEADYDLWLDPTVKTAERLTPLLRPYPAAEMIGYPVSPRVNRAGYEDPDLIAPIEEP